MSVVDTNLLVHATSAASTQHRTAAVALVRLGAAERVAVSRQILREYISVMTGRGFNDVPISVPEAMRAVTNFESMFRILEDGPKVWAEFLRLTRTIRFAGKQVHDANIVATMLAFGEKRLVTFNAKHFRRFEPHIEIITP